MALMDAYGCSLSQILGTNGLVVVVVVVDAYVAIFSTYKLKEFIFVGFCNNLII